jgi:crotonobetainyl-CoA:carnitine CoA-transferase CaiB-like acyl-CoA transferase
MNHSSLQHIRVVDLSRVLAGPTCTQILGDLGADIIKIERPDSDEGRGGDETRFWGPPFVEDEQGNETTESAYYLCANRNKRSVAIDISKPEGQEIVHKLLESADVLVHNFKAHGLDKYGLGYDDIHKRHPHIIYCAISGFGQDGPLSREPGYDFLVQALGGLMASTGEPDGQPMKVGVALSDIMTGLYSVIGILAALHARNETGKGQLVDLSLLDCTIAGMANIAQYYLTSGNLAPRLGNAHSTIVPYQAFETSDGHVIVAIGNDRQFKRFAGALNHPEWAEDERFKTNSDRVRHREELVPLIIEEMKTKTTDQWVKLLQEIDVPGGPVNTMDQTFAMDQVKHRKMQVALDHPLSPAPVQLIGSPLKLSETPVTYKKAPPTLGQHNHEILSELLNFSEEEITKLRDAGII